MHKLSCLADNSPRSIEVANYSLPDNIASINSRAISQRAVISFPAWREKRQRGVGGKKKGREKFETRSIRNFVTKCRRIGPIRDCDFREETRTGFSANTRPPASGLVHSAGLISFSVPLIARDPIANPHHAFCTTTNSPS